MPATFGPMATGTPYANARSRIEDLCRAQAAQPDQADRDDRELRIELLEVLARVVGFDSYVWLLTDPETSVGSSPLADVPFLSELPLAIRLKYLTTVNRWTTLAGAASLLEATAGRPAESMQWRELLCRHGITDGLSAVFRDNFGCWAFLDLWRADADRPFTADEVRFVSGVTVPVAGALRRCQAHTFTDQPGGRPPAGGPAVLLLSPDLQVRARTPPAESYLRVLVPPGPDRDSAVPAGAFNVAAQLIATENAVDDNPALARVHLSSGSWLTMRAARLDTAGAGAGDIAVTIEPAPAADRITVFSRAFGLSQRERQLVQHLARGADTREVAAQLHLSQNTVQDHLKSIFSKTGARSRRLLLSRALGT